jgi:hypothetical protein
MAQLSEWLQLMLAEIARKQEEAQRASEEREQRYREQQQSDSQSSRQYLPTHI